jgi:hypothetical protein
VKVVFLVGLNKGGVMSDPFFGELSAGKIQIKYFIKKNENKNHWFPSR